MSTEQGETFRWETVAASICIDPTQPAECPVCGSHAVTAEWNVHDLHSREADVELRCSSCSVSGTAQIVLPANAPEFFPYTRITKIGGALREQAQKILDRINGATNLPPAASFLANPLWAEAKWSATTYAFHPTSEAPPVMGLVFDNTEAAEDIFLAAKERMHNQDRTNEIRVSIIEGPAPGQEHRPGYTVHIYPDPETLAARATVDGVVLDPTIVPFLGQWNRHYPVPGTPLMLPKFKREFQKHGEYMLAPVVRREDGQLHFEPMLGIVKKTIEFRQLSEISGPDDPDAGALVLPQLITPPT